MKGLRESSTGKGAGTMADILELIFGILEIICEITAGTAERAERKKRAAEETVTHP